MTKDRLNMIFTFAAVFLFGLPQSQGLHKTKVIQVLEDVIDAENFTYYRLQRDGFLQLELTSLKGDVDIYTSAKLQYPSYSDYDMKSDSCGVDTVSIPEEMSRPVYIAIYGHPSYLNSQFRLTIYSLPKPKVETYEDIVAKSQNYFFDQRENSKESESQNSKSESKKQSEAIEENQPLWVKILLGIIEFGIDVII